MTQEQTNPDEFSALLKSYSNIPSEIVEFVAYTIEKGQSNRLVGELIRDSAATAQGLEMFFSRASQITDLDPSEVLKVTGFSQRDLDPSRIESSIAQIRAIFFLDGQQFSDIDLVPVKKHRASDVVGIRKGEKYAVEVLNSIYEAENRFSPEEMASWAFSRVESEGKRKQISATMKELSCSRGAMLAIISTQPSVALQTHKEFMQAATLAWDYIGSPDDIHFCVVTGRVTLGYGPDDAVYPSWPGE